MDCSGIRSSPADKRWKQVSDEGGADPAGASASLAAIGRYAGAEVQRAAEKLMSSLPADLSALGENEVARHLHWLISAGCGVAVPIDEQGAVTVVRRRTLESLRAELVRVWTGDPPESTTIVGVLTMLERAREACTPALDQGFSAELADRGGLDLTVEVAHDMRSPLTSILFLSEILHRGQSGPLNDVQKKQIGIIYSAGLGLVGMASDMIEMARAGNRPATRSASPFSVNEILDSIHDLVSPTAEEKGLELRIRRLETEHRIGYPLVLSRVLLNLATNALKFTHKGYVELSARPCGGSRVEFAVRDTGPGISPDARETLYQPFRREPTRKTGYIFSGTGLGLAICRRLVTAMNAELTLETRDDWGTRFAFEVDLPPASKL
jgi:signal transduction histidine kinase